MNKIYFALLCLFLFSSCNPHLVTQGIKDKTSNYVVTTSGQQINLPHVKSLSNDSISTDTSKYPLSSLSAIKMGDVYYGVQDGKFYDGVYYGKLMLLRRYEGNYYNMSDHTSHSIFGYYLQKQGQPDIVDLTNRNLIDYVDDNPLALRKAKAARIYTNVAYVTIFTTIAGIACVFLPDSSPIRKPAVTIGLFSLPAFLISLPTANHKRYKTVLVYNR
jgi:hypothetical protein